MQITENVKPKSLDTPNSWDAASSGYAQHVAPRLIEPFTSEIIKQLDLNPACIVLEVAAGSGALTAPLSRKVHSLLATDFSPKMMELNRSNCKREGLTNVSFAVMDGQALSLEDEKFDRAACSFGLMLFADRERGFRELFRTLRPSGRVVVTGWASPPQFDAFNLLTDAMKIAFPNLPKPASPPPVFSLADPNLFKSEMETAGFKEVRVEYLKQEISLQHVDQVWQMMTSGAPPVQKLFEKVGEKGKIKIYDALRAVIEERWQGADITLSNTATIGTGIKY